MTKFDQDYLRQVYPRLVRCQRLARTTLDTERTLEKGYSENAIRQLITNGGRLTEACLQVVRQHVELGQLPPEAGDDFARRAVHMRQWHGLQVEQMLPSKSRDFCQKMRERAVPKPMNLDLAQSLGLLQQCFAAIESALREGRIEVRRMCALSREIHCEIVVLMVLQEIPGLKGEALFRENLDRGIVLIRKVANHLREATRSSVDREFVDNIRIRLALLGELRRSTDRSLPEFDYPESEWLSSDSAQLLEELLFRSRQLFLPELSASY